MPIHDWTRVEAGIFHDFHTSWTVYLRTSLNEGLLPEGYYALTEQHAGRVIADILTLHANGTTGNEPWSPPDAGGIAVADAPPRVQRKQTIEPTLLARRRSLAIRHVSGDRLIALIEIVSPGNKDRARHVDELVEKSLGALERGVHLLLLDLFPPGHHDPGGIHGAICQRLEESDELYKLPSKAALTVASYVAGPPIDIYFEHLNVGSSLPLMPLFLKSDRYVNVPLESTYQAAYHGFPHRYRQLLETPTDPKNH